MVIFYGQEEAPKAKELGEKSPESSTRVGRALPPKERAPTSWLTRRPPRRETDAKNSYKSRNPQKET